MRYSYDDFTIKPLNLNDLPSQIFIFMEQCKQNGMNNNISCDAMKFGKWGVEAWWCTWIRERIVAISGAHEWKEYHPGAFRVLVRTATLPEFRGTAPGSLKKMHNDFNWGHVLPYQIAWARRKKASNIYFTTNTSGCGDSNSNRTDKMVKNCFAPQGLARLSAANRDVFFTRQNVWEVC
jgi:hypothetical protein